MNRDEILQKVASGESLAYHDLYGANLSGADMSRANLSGADMSRANLSGAYLHGANLSRADLREANLSRADLSGADLYGANLSGADLSGADLYGANLSSLTMAQLMAIPEEGSFTAWKKLRGKHIAKLLVPEHAKRSSATGRKSRVSEAIVLAIFTHNGEQVDGPIVSMYDPSFTYTVGQTVTPTQPFDEDRWNECAPGIHIFITKQEAIEYV